MARKRTDMNKIREIIRLLDKDLSARIISRVTGISRPVVSECIKGFKESGLEIQKALDMNHSDMLDLIYSDKSDKNIRYEILKSNFEKYSKELKRTGVNIQILWEEYMEEYPDGYSRSQFCYHFQEWRKASREVTMHMEHKAGDSLFVDFTGKKLEITNRETGEKQKVEIFIAVLGASRLIFVEACESQSLEDWVTVNNNVLKYIGGVPKAIVPDNLKSAVNKACKYEPKVNNTYVDFARHYDTVILPTRPYSPRDKALAENAVNIAYSRIFAFLRDEVFYSLNELNERIRELLDILNNRTMQQYKVSRRDLFNEVEKDALNPLPIVPYEIRKYKRLKVGFNYHVYLSEDKHHYSVPYRFKGKEVDLCYSKSHIELFYNNTRITIHSRKKNAYGRYTTFSEHMPPNHKWKNEWNPDRIISWAEKKGDFIKILIKHILSRSIHPEQAYKSCFGILHLDKQYELSRVEKACERAIKYNLYKYREVKNILDNKMENMPIEEDLFGSISTEHENIRGSDYYN